MEVKRTLDVTMEEMDAFIKQTVFQDVQSALEDEEVNRDDIVSGYTYRKKLRGRNGIEGEVVTYIDELTSGCYKASFDSRQGRNYLSYVYEPTEDGKVALTYTEDYDANTKSQDLNYKLMCYLYNRSSKKRANILISHIEELIKENREPV